MCYRATTKILSSWPWRKSRKRRPPATELKESSYSFPLSLSGLGQTYALTLLLYVMWILSNTNNMYDVQPICT